MLFSRRASSFAVCLLAAVVSIALPLHAQSCRGTPRHGGIAYEHGTVSAGSTQGVDLALAGGHTALGLGYRASSVGPAISAYEGSLGFSLIFGAGHLLICPGIGVDYQNEEWTADPDTKLTTHRLGLQGGIGLGYELPLSDDFSVIPFGSADYEFAAEAMQLKATNSNNELSGDTLSHLHFQYGGLARFKFIYAGYVADRYSNDKVPYLARWVVGFTFGGEKKDAKSGGKPPRRFQAGKGLNDERVRRDP